MMSNGFGDGHDHRPPAENRRLDGRVFVAVGCLAVLAVWGSLMVAHRAWKGRYAARAAAGERRLAEAIDPLAAKVPPGVAPAAWGRAVGETHRVLVALAGAGLVGPDRMDALGLDVGRRVAETDTSSSILMLMSLWDDLEAQGGPAIVQPPKGSPLRLARALGFLARSRPRDPAAERTLAMAIDLADATSGLDARAQESLRGRWASLDRLSAADAMAAVWADIETLPEAAATRGRHPRPPQPAGRAQSSTSGQAGRPDRR